jgi:hypothetical protein
VLFGVKDGPIPTNKIPTSATIPPINVNTPGTLSILNKHPNAYETNGSHKNDVHKTKGEKYFSTILKLVNTKAPVKNPYPIT